MTTTYSGRDLLRRFPAHGPPCDLCNRHIHSHLWITLDDDGFVVDCNNEPVPTKTHYHAGLYHDLLAQVRRAAKDKEVKIKIYVQDSTTGRWTITRSGGIRDFYGYLGLFLRWTHDGQAVRLEVTKGNEGLEESNENQAV